MLMYIYDPQTREMLNIFKKETPETGEMLKVNFRKSTKPGKC